VAAGNPKFKSDGYHLKASSPMIDKGKKGSKSHGAKDIDGDKRVLAGDCGAKHPKARRDIGADEFKCPKSHGRTSIGRRSHPRPRPQKPPTPTARRLRGPRRV
jgi:hypothetical protein